MKYNQAAFLLCPPHMRLQSHFNYNPGHCAVKIMSFTCTWSLPPCLKSQTHCLPPHTLLFCLCAGPAPVLLLLWQNQVLLPWCQMSLHPACRRVHKGGRDLALMFQITVYFSYFKAYGVNSCIIGSQI